MNSKIIAQISTVLLCLVLTSSCTPSEVGSPIPENEKYVNQQILLRAPTSINTFGTRDVVVLELKYNSTNEIVFPNNYGLRIFEKTADGWMEIKEIPTETFPPDDIILSPLKEMPAVQSVMFFPDLPDLERKYSLRIYAIGQMSSNGQTIEVMAFTDIVLRP
jgi:hypothetical protein